MKKYNKMKGKNGSDNLKKIQQEENNVKDTTKREKKQK